MILRESDATAIRVASDPDDRAQIWRGRKAAFAAMGRVSPNYYVQDGVVPRTKLSEALRRIEDLSRAAGLRVGNVFHAGDGNLHPLVLYDARNSGEAEQAAALAERILIYGDGRLTDGRARRGHRQGMRDAPDVQ